MKSTKVVIRYARAFLQYSLECKKEEKVVEEMKQLYFAIEEYSNLENFFLDPILSTEKKLKIKRNIFKDFSKETNDLLDLLIKNKREAFLKMIVLKFIDLYNNSKGIVPATVISAVPLSIELEKEIIKKADQLTPLKIKLKKIIDPKILGGFVLRVGDLQYNASLSNRLNILKRELVKS
tara:strand:- start:139 stop:675 length:537 start_codon:yes stop_codon:yes gene_type:complete